MNVPDAYYFEGKPPKIRNPSEGAATAIAAAREERREGSKPASCQPAQAAAPSHSEVRNPRNLNSVPLGGGGVCPPTPLGSTGCEIASGCPPSVPTSWDSGGAAPPRGVPPPVPRGGPRGVPRGFPPPPLLNPGGQKAPAGRPSVIPKAKYMTLGPKFFCCNKMTVTRRRKHLFQ